jgi:hypothetical protein
MNESVESRINNLEKRLQATTEIIEFLEARIKELESTTINMSGVFKNTKFKKPKIQIEFDGYICDGCGKGFDNKEDLEDISTPGISGICMCKECLNK